MGAFMLLLRRAGEFTIRLSHPSYAPVSSRALSTRPRETLELVLRMGRSSIPLEALVVAARGMSRLDDFHDRSRRAAGFGRFIIRADIEQRPGAMNVTDLLRAVPGVELVTADRTTGRRLIAVRGPPPRAVIAGGVPGLEPCEPAIFVDGMSFQQRGASTVDDLLRPEMIEGVEIYTRMAGAPAEFVEPGKCGVVAFWSRAGAGRGSGWSWTKLLAAAGGFTLVVLLVR